jgi:chemotaxis response regulator CheB
VPINVLLADNSAIMRKAVARLLESDPEIQLVAEARAKEQTERQGAGAE